MTVLADPCPADGEVFEGERSFPNLADDFGEGLAESFAGVRVGHDAAEARVEEGEGFEVGKGV